MDPVHPSIGGRQLKDLLWKELEPHWNKFSFNYPFPKDAVLVVIATNLKVFIPESREKDVSVLMAHLKPGSKKNASNKQLELGFRIGFRDVERMKAHAKEVLDFPFTN